ncbi:spore germination protein, partial [Pseudomonas sp. FW305-BF6]|uniref:spore germination protein n=1 Tax=Pseudomonas sp. FW305-BF6 TaxID=2070673 RepID=UPI0011AECF1C
NHTTSSDKNLSGNLTYDLQVIKKEIGHNSDVIFREFQLGDTTVQVAVIFIDGLCDIELIQTHIMGGLMLGLTSLATKQQLEDDIERQS